MAVIETGAIFNSLVFGGINSADYGIYITGEAVYNAPVRAVEMVSVPGRNGAIIVDQGYYENIEVSYPAGCFGSTQSEFAEAIASFRNAIVAQSGYNRLTDTYHPEEFRMATYLSGLEVEAVQSGKAGEFELVFNAKPQRFLTSGETKVSISTSGATVGNPTLYDASPLIEVEGYGTINIGDYEIEIDNALLGDVTLRGTGEPNYCTTTAATRTVSGTFDSVYVNNGDTVTINNLSFYNGDDGTTYYGALLSYAVFKLRSSYSCQNYGADATLTNTNAVYSEFYLNDSGRNTYGINSLTNPITFTIGTASSVTSSTEAAFSICNAGTSTVVGSARLSVTTTFSYDGDNGFSFSMTRSILSDSQNAWTLADYYSSGVNSYIRRGALVADSTLSILGTPTYIDCDLGVCYKIESDTVIDLNAYIDLGSDLPVLSPGSNTITYDNTITSVDIVPRWWQL